MPCVLIGLNEQIARLILLSIMISLAVLLFQGLLLSNLNSASTIKPLI